MDREEELYILLNRIFPHPYAGSSSDGNSLFDVCKKLGSSYCMKFNDNGYDEKYARYESDKVIREVAIHISDEQLRDLFRNNKERLSSYYNFLGSRYTYWFKTKELSMESEQENIRKQLHELIEQYSDNGKAILGAIYELNFERNMAFRNYLEVIALALKKGYKRGIKGKGYPSIFSDLILIGIIDHDRKDLRIFEELAPLVKEELML